MVDPRHFKRPESVMVVVHTDAEILLIKRADHECFWQSVTGSLEWNEAKETTASRELAEETGIKNVPIRFTGVRRSYEILEQWRYKFPPGVKRNYENLFFCHLPGRVEIDLDPTEHTEYQWLSYQEAIDTAYSWTNKLAIEMLK